jgi:arginine deiminase
MWAKKAKEEHDAFAEALRDKGVQMHYFGQLLGETLALPEGRTFCLRCTPIRKQTGQDQMAVMAWWSGLGCGARPPPRREARC